jgi:spore maturation protein CgeB
MRSKALGSSPWMRGRRAGYRQGWREGWRLGACDRIDKEIHPQSQRIRQARLLYVPQGFEAIDQGLIAALQQAVFELRVASPADMKAAAEAFKPDAVLVMNGLHVFPQDHLNQIDGIRALGIKTAIWFADDPYVCDETVNIAPHYDYVFTHEQSCVSLYRSLGCERVYHLPLAAHFGLFQPLKVTKAYRTDICFIGVAFRNRIQLFDEIAPYLKGKNVFIGGVNWHRLSQYAQLKSFIKDGWTEPSETVRYYNGAKIVINLHRSPEHGPDNHNATNRPAVSINPRTYELAACGAMQLTDWRDELPAHYEVGSEIAVYRNAKELTEQLDYYLRNEKARLRMAARGYRRTKSSHTFASRVEQLMDAIGLK